MSPPESAEKIYVPGISDFGKINDFLYRGAQPKHNGVEQLKKFGIDTIVDLRGELPGLIQKERQRRRIPRHSVYQSARLWLGYTQR